MSARLPGALWDPLVPSIPRLDLIWACRGGALAPTFPWRAEAFVFVALMTITGCLLGYGLTAMVQVRGARCKVCSGRAPRNAPPAQSALSLRARVGLLKFAHCAGEAGGGAGLCRGAVCSPYPPSTSPFTRNRRRLHLAAAVHHLQLGLCIHVHDHLYLLLG